MHPGGQAILFATDLDESSSVNAQLCELRKDGTMVDDSTQGGELEASEAEIEGALEGLPIAPEQLEMAEEQYAVRSRLIPSSSLRFFLVVLLLLCCF